jgi:predicted nucleic acid-binding protein
VSAVSPLGLPLFVDASAWIGASNRRDQHHEQARALLEECFARRVRLVTTTWVAYEALSVIKSRVGAEAASALWSLLTDRSSVTLIRVNDDYEARGLDLFFSYRDKSWGVVDCTSLIAMEDLGCRQAFGFDRHFTEATRQRGFEVLPELG